MDEALRTRAFGVAVHATEALGVGIGRHETGPIMADALPARAVHCHQSTFRAVRAAVRASTDVRWRNKTSGRRLAGHCHRSGSGLGIDGVGTGETTGGRQKAVTLVGASADCGSGIGDLGWRAVDICRPVLDLVLPLLLVAAHTSLVSRILATEDPLEDQSERKLGHDDGQNEDERNVEHDLGRNAANSLRVDRPDFDNLLETLGDFLLRARDKGKSVVLATDGLVCANVVKERRVRHLGRVEPLEEVQIQDVARVDHQVAAAVADIIPGEENVARALKTVEGVAGVARGVARVSEIVTNRSVWRGRTVLVEGVAREVPSEVSIVVGGNVGVLCGSDEALAFAVDILEQETAVLATVGLVHVPENVSTTGDTARKRMT